MGKSDHARIAKNSLMLYLRMFISMGVSLYTSRVVIQTLGVEEFGVYNIVGGVIIFLSFISSSMSSASVRFLCADMESEETGSTNIFKTIFRLHLLMALLALVLGLTIGLWFVKNKLVIPTLLSTDAVQLFYFVILTSILTLITTPFTSLLVAHERFQAYAWIEVLNVVLRLVIVFLLMLPIERKLVFYGALQSGVALLILLFYAIYCSKKISNQLFVGSVSHSFLKTIAQFVGIDLYGNLSVVARTQGINILLNLFFGPILNAASGIAAQVQGAVMTFGMNIQTAIKPHILKSYANKQYDDYFQTIAIGVKFVTFLLYLISLPLILRIDYVLSLWLGELPPYSSSFVICTLIFNLGASMSLTIANAIHAVGDIRRLSFINGSLYLLVVPFTYIAFRLEAPPIFPFLLNALFVFLGFTINTFTLRKLVPSYSIVATWKKGVLPLIAVVGITFPSMYIVNEYIPTNFWGLLLFSFITVVGNIFVAWFILLDKNYQNLIKTYLWKRLKI